MITLNRKEALGFSISESGTFKCDCYNQFNELIWSDTCENSLTNEGMQWAVGVAFGTLSKVVDDTFYMGLYSSDTPSIDASSTLASLESYEITNTGYSRQPVIGNVDEDAQIEAGRKVIFEEAIWTPPTNWRTVRYLFLADVESGSSGKILAYSQLSEDRILHGGDSLRVTYTITQATT